MAQAEFQLAIIGFQCISETWDTFGEGDGKGDEVFFNVARKTLDNQGDPIILDVPVPSKTMGDTNNFPNRINVGSRSAKGGIKTGDNYPPVPWLEPVAFNDDYPPYIVFKEVINDQAGVNFSLIITLWESDEGGDMFGAWAGWLQNVDAEFGPKLRDIVKGAYPLALPIFDLVGIGIKVLPTLGGAFAPLGKNGTRMIGLQQDPDNKDDAVANPQGVILTYDLVMKLLEYNPTARGKGIFTLEYRDDPRLNGHYVIWLQLTRTWIPRSIANGTFITSPGHPENYVVFGGARFLIPDPQTFDRLTGGQGHAIQQSIDDKDLMALSTVPADSTYLIEESSQVGYRMHGTLRRQVDHPGNVIAWWCRVPDGSLKDIPIESIVQAENTAEVYVIIKAVRYLITGQDQLDHFTGGGGQSSVHVISAADLAKFPTVPAEGTYLQEMGDGHIYKMHAGMRDLVNILVPVDQITTVPTGSLAGIVIRSLPHL